MLKYINLLLILIIFYFFPSFLLKNTFEEPNIDIISQQYHKSSLAQVSRLPWLIILQLAYTIMQC